jgi:F420H(2)-dependent quinone reductase
MRLSSQDCARFRASSLRLRIAPGNTLAVLTGVPAAPGDPPDAGRRSGRESTRPVWFVRDEAKLYLVPIYGVESEWYKNVLARPDVQVVAQGTELRP